MKSIQTLKNLEGKRVLLRTDFNVPLGSDGRVSSEEAGRIDASIPTIQYLKKSGAKIIIISHIGRKGTESLEPIANYLTHKKIKVQMVDGHLQDFVHEAIDSMKNGDILMLKNLRADKAEMSNGSSFARGLSRLADIYVNDAFAVCHRRHASIVGIPKFLKSYAGFLLHSEIQHLQKIQKNPKKPFVFVLGGAKFETKLPLIKKYLPLADVVVVGGALQNNFFKALGFEVGKSLVDTKRYNLGGLIKTQKIVLAEDVVVTSNEGVRLTTPNAVQRNEKIVDIGPQTIQTILKHFAQAKTILWNGPLGLYEEGFDESTIVLAKALAKSSAFSVVGGGDTVVTLKELKLEKKIDFVSTGGGAMLEFLQKGTLPGIDALNK